ncbi:MULTISPECIES: hypothetical protein [unclassified Stenotrophomonas]|uniref:hypothetical protein n=1 Tax=unclassified Stenotrophomonas TaxID=196198 RepID=UPI003012A0C6
MGDNKISEAAPALWGVRIGDSDTWGYVEVESDADFIGRQSGLSYEKRPFYTHLHGEAVPVAWLIDWPDEPDLGHYFAEEPSINARSQPLYTHPQPAELSEVSGNSGELPPLPEPSEMGYYIDSTMRKGTVLGYNREQMQDYARAALAATGKQQGGEVPNFAACCAEGGGSISGCSCANTNHVYLASQASLTAEERAHGETIDQRDRYHEVADDLAAHIARITGTELGEHSSVNCPWQNAIEAAEGYTPAHAPSPVATRKLGELAAQGYVTNGVAIFNPATGRRGLVDNLGYVGWQGAQGIDLGYIRAMAARWRTDRMREGMGWQEAVSSCADQLDVALALLDGRDAGTGVGNIQPPRDLRTKLGEVG